MKKIITAIMAIGMMSSALSASMSYECWGYKNGKPEWWISISAESKSEAESLAMAKFKNELDRNPDYVKCK